MARIMNTKLLQHHTVLTDLSRAQSAAKVSHTLACRYDDIDPESKFTVFSKGNPFVAALNADMGRLQAARLARIEAVR